MENNIFEDVLNVLVDVKVELQRLKSKVQQELVKRIDACISKVAPLIDVYASNSYRSLAITNSIRDRTVSHKQMATFDKKFEIREINLEQQREELQKVRRSFLKEEEELELSSSSLPKNEIIIDYFMFKYDFKLKQYIILGRQGGEKSDRKVFLDLFTQEKKKSELKKLEKTQSMTNILKAIYTPDKVSEPFILPNCQEEQIKYLFLFGLHECGSHEKDFYRTETLYCFVTRQFILGQLTNLMDSIAKICFEKRISQITPSEDQNIHHIIENVNAKKTFHAIQQGIEDFLKSFDYDSTPNLTVSKMQRWKSNTLDHYLQRSSVRWTLVKKPKSKQQKCFLTLVLLFYFAICEYKIIIITQNQNKHIISELIVGLLSALEPLTFIYPIVTATISPHHMEFTNSPVPLLLGLWGNPEYHSIAKSNLKKLLKHQKQLSREELQRQTLTAFIDIQDNTVGFLDLYYKQVYFLVEKIQTYIEMKFDGSISQKLSYFLSELLVSHHNQCPEWMNDVRRKMMETQMYEFLTNKNKA